MRRLRPSLAMWPHQVVVELGVGFDFSGHLPESPATSCVCRTLSLGQGETCRGCPSPEPKEATIEDRRAGWEPGAPGPPAPADTETLPLVIQKWRERGR